MKLFALLFIVGLAAATGEWEWNTGKEYVFEYKGRLITGFPKLSSQYSGLGLKAKVVVKVLEPDHFLMLVEDPKHVEVNDILKPEGDIARYGPEGTNWRHLELPETRPVPEEYRKILSKPVGVRFSYEGEVTSIVIDSDEPEWSVNFKKGIISLFQTKVDRFSLELEENRLEERKFYQNDTNTWKVKEPSIDGVCENQYSLSKLPRYYVKEHPETVPLPEACEDTSMLYRVTKLRNTDNCEKRAIYSFFKPGYFNCRGETGANCSPMWSRSSYTTYIACPSKRTSEDMRGPSMQRRLVIQSVVNEAELSSYLFGYSTEKIVTGNRQILKLKEIRPFRPNMNQEHSINGSPRTITSLMYEFDRKDLVRDGSRKHVDTRKALMDPEIISKTNQFIYAKGAGVHLPREEIIREVIELLSEVSKDLKSSSSKIIEAHVNMKLLGVAKGMSMLEEPNVFMEIYKKIENNPIMINLFFDTVTISGTPAAVIFIKDMMLSGKMTSLQKAQFFMWIPQYLVAPTPATLRTLFELIKSERIQSSEVSPVIRGLAYSSLSRLIHMACISEDRLNSYPTWVFGEFCSPDSDVVNNLWVPFLKEKIRSTRSKTERDISIMSLGLVAKKTIIPTLLQVIKGKVGIAPLKEGTMKPASTARQLALYSLVSVGFREPHLVSPILLSVLKDPSENLEMRVAAFNGLMKMGPPSVHILQDIVGMTHQDIGIDMELLKVINTGLYSAGHQELHPNMEFQTVEMIKNAKMAYHMVRKIKGVYPTSATFFTSTFLKNLDVGYDVFLSYVRSQESFLPKRIFAEIKYLLVNFNIKPIQIGLSLGSTSHLHKKLAEVLASKEKLQETIQEHLTSGLNNGWRKIVQELKEDQTEEDISGEMSSEYRDRASLFIKLFETSFLYFNFESLTSSHTVRQLVKELFLQKEQVNVDKRVEVQKVMDVVPFMITIPSDMGFPINIRLHYPMTFSFSGDVRARLSAGVQSLEVSGKLAFASQLTGYIGTYSPFSKELICTGVDQHSVVDLPGEVVIKTNIPEQKLVVELRRMEAVESLTDVMHFHVIPFTVRTKLTSLKPLVKSENFKPIESDVKPKEWEYEVGESLGLKLKLKYKTESAFRGLSNIWELLSVYKFPWNMLAFRWISPSFTAHGRPSLRKYKFTASLDTSSSATKEIKMEFKLGYSTKKAGHPIKYHKIHVLESLSGSNGYLEGIEDNESPILKTIKKHLPYRIKSESLEKAIESHPKRAEKIREVLEKIIRQEGEELASAFSLISSITLKGGARPRTWTYSITLGTGKNSLSNKAQIATPEDLMMMQKWSMKLEGFRNKHVCITGHLSLPVLPMWNINDLKSTLSFFELKNIIASGESDCGESSVETFGRFVSSEKQRKYALESLEAKECLRLTSAHGHSKHSICRKAMNMATTVDVVEIDNKFKNVSPFVTHLEYNIVDYLRGVLWPYLLVDKKVGSEESLMREDMRTYETSAKIKFHSASPSYDLVIKRPREELIFENVHIRSPYRMFFPLKVGRKFDSASLLEGKLSSSPYHQYSEQNKYEYENNYKNNYRNNYNQESYYSEEYELNSESYYRCLATPDSVITYKNRTVPYKKSYECEHLLTGDCGAVKHFFVSEVLKKNGEKKVKINLRDSWVEIIGDESSSRFTVIVDGREISLVEGSEIELKDSRSKILGTFSFKKSEEYALKLRLPRYYLEKVYFNGRDLIIVPSLKLKSEQLCGLCGTLRSHRMSRSQVCEYSAPELTFASNRIGSYEECPSLEEPLKEQLKREKELCRESGRHKSSDYYAYKKSSSLYNQEYEVPEGQCIVPKHIIIRKSGEVCLSKVPVLRCKSQCVAKHQIEKEVPFVCMPEGRMASYYTEKVEEGKVLKELRSMETSFRKEIRQDKKCIYA